MKHFLLLLPLLGVFYFNTPTVSFDIKTETKDTVYIHTFVKPHVCEDKGCPYKNQLIFVPDSDDEEHTAIDLIHFTHPSISFEKADSIWEKTKLKAII